jgi:hypothetical protein
MVLPTNPGVEILAMDCVKHHIILVKFACQLNRRLSPFKSRLGHFDSIVRWYDPIKPEQVSFFTVPRNNDLAFDHNVRVAVKIITVMQRISEYCLSTKDDIDDVGIVADDPRLNGTRSPTLRSDRFVRAHALGEHDDNHRRG